MGRVLRITRCVGAVGFVVVRWLSAVCNVPAICGWLEAASWVLAAALAVALFRSSPGVRYPVLGGRDSRLLLLTCVLNLPGIPLSAVGAEPSGWQTALGGGLDLVAWGWALYGALLGAGWVWGREAGAPAGAPARLAPRHLLLSVLIASMLGLQVAALFKPRPTWWPFIDYPLYSRAHGTPTRTLHFRLYGVTDEAPPALVEITAGALGMSWFVYHTQLLPRMFNRPWSAHERFRRTLLASDLPPFTSIMAEGTWFVLEDGELNEYPELRRLAIAPTAGDPETARRGEAAAPPAGGAAP